MDSPSVHGGHVGRVAAPTLLLPAMLLGVQLHVLVVLVVAVVSCYELPL